MNRFFISVSITLAFCSIKSFSQTQQPQLTATILHLDSAFWNAYNNCDTAGFRNFFTDDVEFYHDKGGITLGAATISGALSKNLCSNKNFRLRREAVPATVQVYPMHDNNVLYGAIITGEHLFYITENGKPEYLDGDANFTHLWILKDGVWKMKRILSYNHHAASFKNTRTEIILKDGQLDKLAGKYMNNLSDTMTVQRKDHLLEMKAGNNSYTLYPQSENIFFVKDRDLLFEFIKDNSGSPLKIIVKEKGVQVDELLFKK